jgi:hypothetical protein
MALPKLETPTYKLKIPSTGKTVTYRPFLVKEEKLLLMTKESQNTKETMDMVQRLIETCLMDDIDVSSLTPYDIEYIFLMLRSKSIGEEVEFSIKCESCESSSPVMVNLENDIKIEKPKKKISNKVSITNNVGVILKEPSMKTLSNVNPEDSIGVLISCIESIYDDKTVHRIEDYDISEVREFIEALNMKELGKLQQFFENTTKLTCEIRFVCSCGHENKLRIEGLSDFF